MARIGLNAHLLSYASSYRSAGGHATATVLMGPGALTPGPEAWWQWPMRGRGWLH